MDYVNETLMLSLKQDLQTLNASIENINTDSDLQSWLFPTKNYKFVNDFIKENNDLGLNNVRLVLELIIDRLYIGLRLIVSTIEETIKTDGNEANDFVFKPPQMTIACCFENLRKVVDIALFRMAEMRSEINPERANTLKVPLVKNRNRKNSKTQTDVVSMASCDSCASAIMSMKFLLDIFDVAKDDIYQVRRVKSSLHDLTQFGCMLHTTASIENSLKQLIEKLMKSDDENKELAEKVKILTNQLQNKNGANMLLEQENIALNDTLKKTGVQLAILKNKITDLEISKLKAEQKIQSLSTLNEGLNSTLSIYREVNTRLKDEKILLEKNCNKTTEIIKQCIEEIPKLDKKLSVIEKQEEYLLAEFNHLSTCLENLTTKLKNISTLHNGMENKLKMITSDIGDNTKYITEEIKAFQLRVQEKFIQIGLNTVSNTNTKIQIIGNPIEDFSRQIEENNEKIKALQCENKKLETLLLKFKSIKK